MDSKELLGLVEAYTAVYDEDLREDLYEEYEYVDDLYDEELEEVVEEVIYDLLGEGYDFEDVEDILKINLIGEVLSEARVDMAARAARRKAADAASEKAAKETRSRASAKERADKRAERIARVKGAIKGGIDKVKSAVKSGISKAKEAGREAKFQAVDKKVAKYATDRKLHPAAGMAARSKDPEKRRALRKKVAGDIASRAQVAAYGKGREVAQSASDTARRAKQGIKNVAARAGRAVSGAKSATKSGVKGAIRKAAEKVASGASKVAKRMEEDFEIWVEDLLDEGYDLSEYTWEDLAEAYMNLEEARKLRPASERMARTMTASDRAKQKRERALRDAGQQALADIRALAKGKSSRTTPSSTQSTPDAEVRRIPTGQKVDKLAMKAKRAMGEEVEVFDVVLDFLFSEGYAETLEEAEWIMANLIDEEAIAIVIGESSSSRLPGESESAFIMRSRAEYNRPRRGPQHETTPSSSRSRQPALMQRNPDPKGGDYKSKLKKNVRASRTEEYVNEGVPLRGTTPDGKPWRVDPSPSGARRSAKMKRQPALMQRNPDPNGGDYKSKLKKNDRYESFEAWLDEAMTNYEKNRKRAAARNAARD